MIDWRRGYRVTSWRVFRVGRETWADSTEVEGIVSASVERSTGGDGLIERGSLTVLASIGETLPEDYYRIVMTAEQGGISERVSVATLLLSIAEGDVERHVDELRANGRSVLYPASTTPLHAGAYFPAGSDGVAWCVRMLSQCINAPVQSDGHFTVDDHIVFDSGTMVLDAVWRVLNAGAFTIQIDGDGVVHIVPMPTEPALTLDHANTRLLHTRIHHALDWSEVPNTYVVLDGVNEVTAINDDPTSVTSTVVRGWTSARVDTSPTRVNGETLQAYAERRLEEESTITDSRSYSREWWPDVHPYSIVRGSIESVGLMGDLRVVSQSLTLGRGITVEEESNREVVLWQR